MIEIGWTPYKFAKHLGGYELEFIHNLYFEPERLIDFYKDSKSMFKNCPANASFLKQFWVIKSPVDLTLNLDRKNKSANINQNQMFYDQFIDMRWDQYSETDLALCTFYFQYMFVADDPVWIEVYPPFLHGEVENTRFINGTFDIQKWQRPVDFSFEILDDTKKIEVKRGQPLFYIKFSSPKFSEDFKLKQIEWTDELLKMNKRCQPQNWVKGLAWKLANIGNKGRPKKLVK